jgi:ParB-like chromosome segregation protein Spo0J
MASDADFENLRASIADRGFLASEPIVLIGNPPMILDGRNRFRAAKACGVKLTVTNFLLFNGSEAEAEAFSNAKNGARRHLTTEQKVERIKAYIAANPEMSSRDIARKLGVSHVTVEKYRALKTDDERAYLKFMAHFRQLSEENKAKFHRECSQ